jgi:hypothetical protein
VGVALQPESRCAKSGELRIAYQVVGDGPVDLVFGPGFVSNIELLWERPGWANFSSRLAGFSRLILFDRRGTSLSDRFAGISIWKNGWTTCGRSWMRPRGRSAL